MRRPFRTAFVVVLVVVAFAAGWIRLPYYAIGPGPARDVAPLIRFDDRPRYESSGRLVITTVRIRPLTPITALIAWLDPSRDVVPRREVFPPGVNEEEEEVRARSEMDQSKIDATYVVLHRLADYPREHGEGAVIEGVYPGCPADGKLFAGDHVSAIDGEPVDSQGDASAAIDRAGRRITFRVSAGGETHDVEVGRARCIPDDDRRYVGVGLVDAFPFDVQMSSGEVGGPSAGLMWAIGLYDLLTPGDVTGGRTVAGTGTIDLRGRIGPIGSIVDKVVAAQRAEADVFLVPQGNLRELHGVDAGGMRIVPVSTFAEALEALGA